MLLNGFPYKIITDNHNTINKLAEDLHIFFVSPTTSTDLLTPADSYGPDDAVGYCILEYEVIDISENKLQIGLYRVINEVMMKAERISYLF